MKDGGAVVVSSVGRLVAAGSPSPGPFNLAALALEDEDVGE